MPVLKNKQKRYQDKRHAQQSPYQRGQSHGLEDIGILPHVSEVQCNEPKPTFDSVIFWASSLTN